METRANYVAVGVFVLTSAMALVIALLWFAGFQYSHEYEYYRTYFHGAVNGLGNGTAVRYNGIDVGRITDLAFDPHDPQIVVVTLQIQPGLGIRTDSVSSIEPQGLTGGSYVEISGGTRQASLLRAGPGEEYPVIKTAPSALQQLTAGAPELLAKLNTIADRLVTLLSDDNQRHLSATLVNLDRSTASIAARSGDISATLTNISAASQALPTTLATANATMTKVGRLADDTDSLMRNEGLAELPALVADTRRTVNNLNRLTEQLDQQPTRLLFGDRRRGYTPP
jgi:phospholipid/cholesterol/gamma-HCH transport system substrate-binding protein